MLLDDEVQKLTWDIYSLYDLLAVQVRRNLTVRSRKRSSSRFIAIGRS